MEKYTVTGNDYISLPQITGEGDILSVGLLSMQARGLFSLSGAPFLRAFVGNGEHFTPTAVQEEKLGFWIPRFCKTFDGGRATQTVLAPIEGKGFLVRLEYENTSSQSQTITLGFDGTWNCATRETNSSEPLFGNKTLAYGWHGAPMYALNGVLPLFCFSFLCDSETQNTCACDSETATYSLQKNYDLQPHEKATLTLAIGFGMDGVSAVTAALDFLRHGFDTLLQTACGFLQSRTRTTGNTLADFRLHYNLFFCYFFSAGRTLDTEQFVMVTSRSPRYYVSAAYWDRDSLLWAFPAILAVDEKRAREMLVYAFTTQLPHAGEHSRFIDGTLLEPGFELDELCAPLIALCQYCNKTGTPLWKHAPFSDGISQILTRLERKKHPVLPLYETFLYPSDDMRKYPYLTYDNALAAYALRQLGNLLRDENLLAWSKKIQQAVLKNAVTEHNGKRLFAWSFDLQGKYELYDEPPGSLTLLSYLGLCDIDNEIFCNTLAWLYSSAYPFSFLDTPFSQLGCAHANHPWVLSYCNAVFSGVYTDETLQQMLTMPMDGGLACESVSEHTGETATGEAFATCAGAYSYALLLAFGVERIPG